MKFMIKSISFLFLSTIKYFSRMKINGVTCFPKAFSMALNNVSDILLNGFAYRHTNIYMAISHPFPKLFLFFVKASPNHAHTRTHIAHKCSLFPSAR